MDSHRLNRLLLGFPPLLYAAVVLSMLAAWIHTLVLPDHYAEWWGYGLFFLVVAAGQIFASGALFLWPSRSTFLAVAIGNGCVVVMYIVTRTVGIPLLGPHAGDVEDVQGVDLLTTISEVILVIVAVKLIRDRRAGSLLPNSPFPIRAELE